VCGAIHITTIDDKIKVMDEGNSRIQVIQIDTNASPICLINVYMPSDNKEMDCEYKIQIGLGCGSIKI
jgi:hypothetical protein